MFDIQEYANAKGIPVESIPADVFDKAQGKSYAIREAKDPMADTFKEICTKSQELLAACTSESGSSDGSSFPAACANEAVKHMECLINKRDTAYQLAVKLAGKDECEKVFPYYEDNKKKALDMIGIYKHSAEGEKASTFWG
ncbi:unnamed protein product [Pseudo-nitzschia multistriata]|uniref:Uncharacterized protein n=1 Tax=Pseudo-nitzschia multistriata TaxID=183589 RepID=A0A448Z6K4_9STRA|nr:unnamed protein product [Pseudo-nitzschia multistriata]